MLFYILLYFLGWIFTSVLLGCTFKQDPKSYIVWGEDEFVLVEFLWPLTLPPLLVFLAVRYFLGK